MKKHLLTVAIAYQVLTPQLKIKNHIIWQCLPGQYEQCGNGPIAFPITMRDGSTQYLVKNKAGRWVISDINGNIYQENKQDSASHQ